MKSTRFMSLLVFVCLVTVFCSLLQAQIIVTYDAGSISDAVAPDPVSVGWVANINGSASGVDVSPDNGFDAWQAYGVGGRANWRVTPIYQADHASASQNGWRMTVIMRVLSGASIANYYGNGTMRFLPQMRVDPDGVLIADLLGGGGSYTLMSSSGSDAYHEYVTEYDPATRLGTFYFDGSAIASWAGEPSTQDLVTWGNGGSTTDGVANYRFVQFEVFESVLAVVGSPVVSEQGSTTDYYTISLTKAPTANVSITITPNLAGAADIDLGAGVGNSITLTFTPGNWANGQSVSVTAVDDEIEEGPHKVTLNHLTASTDPEFDGVSKLVIVTIEDDDRLFIVKDLFIANQEGPQTAPYYRIPSIIQAADGSLLTFVQGRFSGADPGLTTGGIEMHVKSSVDNGVTWSDLMVPLANPDSDGNLWDYNAWNPVVIDGTGESVAPLGFFFTRWPDTARTTESFWMTTSDGGLTWTTPVEITSQIQEPTWTKTDAGPGRAIQLKWQTDPSRNGRLVFSGKRTTDAIAGVSFYSDDFGATFTHGAVTTGPSGGANENEVVELTNGDLLMDGRKQGASHRHRWISSDGGENWTWSDTSDFDITTVDCSLIRYSARRSGDDRDRLIFSGPLGSPIYSGFGRYNIAVWTSYDEGKTFINPVHIQPGFGGYSALEKLNDGSVGLLYEAASKTKVRFVRFGLSYLEGQTHSDQLCQYDGFGNEIDRLRGGMGWTGSWVGDAEFNDSVVVEFGDSSIMFDGFPFQTEAGRVDLVAGQSAQRVLSDSFDLNSNSVKYVSLVVSGALDSFSDQTLDEGLRIELRDGSNVTHASFGVNSDESFFAGMAGDTVSTSPDMLSGDGVYFLVAKIVSKDDSSGGNHDQIYLKVFESGIDSVPESENSMEWTLVGTPNTNSNGVIDRIVLVGESGATFSIDEIRIGSSFGAVAFDANAPCTFYLRSDINRDCYVNLLDLMILAGDWLKCSDPADLLNCEF